MNTLEKLFVAVFVIVVIFGSFYIILMIDSFSDSEATELLGAAVMKTAPESVKFAINNDVFKLNEHESIDYKYDGRLYRVTLINVNTQDYPFCQIIVDGDITEKLHIGETDSLFGLKIKIGEIYT